MIQYSRREPTDEELDEAEPGEEPEADDDIEQAPAPKPTPKPKPKPNSTTSSSSSSSSSSNAAPSTETVVQEEALLLDGGRGREGGVQELEKQEEQGRALANGHVTEAAASRQLLRGAGTSK